MAPFVYPEQPHFEDDSERVVWDALVASLGDDDVLMHGVRFSDPEYGEVEVDLIVLMPDYGAAVIEVKGGHVTFADGVWEQTGAGGSQTIDPIKQARNGMYALRRFLGHQPNWSRGQLRTEWLIALPYTNVLAAMGPEGRRETIIGRDDVAAAEGFVRNRLRNVRNDTPMPTEGWVEAALEHLLGRHDKPAEIAGRTAARLRHLDELVADQARVLRMMRMNPRLDITGSAGTGKTWLAIEQARLWAREGERVCFVSYGRGVAAMVSKAMADLRPNQQPAFIGSFFQLGDSWGAIQGGSDSEDFWSIQAPAIMLKAAMALPDSSRFTAFIVDEAQDFRDSWWNALLASAANPDFKLAVFRDDEQAVFTERRGKPMIQLTCLLLDENLRNSRQIVDVFQPLIDAHVLAHGGEGFPVEYIDCPADEVIQYADDAVGELVDHRGWLPEHVVLLTTKSRHPVHVERAGDRTEYWQGMWDTNDTFYSTVSGFKGLERAVVVLAVNGFHDGVNPKSVLYAGMSRARDLLIIVGPSAQVSSVLNRRTMNRLTRKHG